MNKITIAVYGSLRRGEFNYNEKDMEYVGTTRLNGYDLIDLGVGYPAIVPSRDMPVTVDLMEVEPKVFYGLNSMETGAGYTLSYDHALNAFFWYMPRIPEYFTGAKPVESGDWSALAVK